MKIKSILSALFVLLLSTTLMFGQTNNVKIGYTNPEYILSAMPEYKQVESELMSHDKLLKATLDNKMKEYQAKFEDYQKNINTWPDVVKQDKEKELISMKSNIEEFEQTAMASLQKKQGQLLDPIVDKIQNAINEVAKENGYTYIFNTNGGNNMGIILYSKNTDEDISELVLKKLGVAIPAKSEAGTTTTPAGTGTTKPAGTGTTPSAPVKKK